MDKEILRQRLEDLCYDMWCMSGEPNMHVIERETQKILTSL